MGHLKDGAYTGSKEDGNPYDGDLSKGIEYDKFEVNCPIVVQEGNYPQILGTYRAAARELVKHSSVRGGQRVLDMGSGTGISTLELLQQKKGTSAVGIEMSEGMLLVAKYKFHQNDGKEILAQVQDERVLQYWNQFKEESIGYSDRVEFLPGDIQVTEDIAPESLDSAIGSQFMHWTDLSRTFKQLNRFLKEKGEVIWSSASHFYDDAPFPAAKYGFRYNDFLAYVLDEVCSEGKLAANDYRSLSKPVHNFESIKSITAEQGFETEQVATNLRIFDLQFLVQNQIPVFVRNLITSEVDPKGLEALIKSAIGKAIVNPKALRDLQHKYEIVPVFKSVKMQSPAVFDK